jgi:hypothetical protein
MESFQPGLSFTPVSRAEISSRPKAKILLKHSAQAITWHTMNCCLHGMSFSLLGWWLSPVEVTRAESLHVIDRKFQPALKKQRNLSGFISVWTILQCDHSLAEVKYETWKTPWIFRRSSIAPFWDLLVSAPRFHPAVWTEIVAYPGLKICHVIDIVKQFRLG